MANDPQYTVYTQTLKGKKSTKHCPRLLCPFLLCPLLNHQLIAITDVLFGVIVGIPKKHRAEGSQIGVLICFFSFSVSPIALKVTFDGRLGLLLWLPQRLDEET